jgi:hypothetical protein
LISRISRVGVVKGKESIVDLGSAVKCEQFVVVRLAAQGSAEDRIGVASKERAGVGSG